MSGNRAAIAQVAGLLDEYLQDALTAACSAAGISEQTVASVSHGRHLGPERSGTIGVWVEEAGDDEQLISPRSYTDREVAVIVEAQVATISPSEIDRARECWADAILQVLRSYWWQPPNDAGFFSWRRSIVQDNESSYRTPGGIRGVLGALGVLQQPVSIDRVRVTVTFAQRVRDL